MKASEILKKNIIVEIIALFFLVFAIFYATFAISKSSKNQVKSIDGFVTVLDDSKFEKLSPKSDGAGLESLGSAYTITNNNSDEKEYNIVISSNNHNEKVLSQIKVAIDDLYVYNLTDLERSNGGYILRTYKLKPGYTKNHIIKAWYKQDTDESLIKDIKFEYRIETL